MSDGHTDGDMLEEFREGEAGATSLEKLYEYLQEQYGQGVDRYRHACLEYLEETGVVIGEATQLLDIHDLIFEIIPDSHIAPRVAENVREEYSLPPEYTTDQVLRHLLDTLAESLGLPRGLTGEDLFVQAAKKYYPSQSLFHEWLADRYPELDYATATFVMRMIASEAERGGEGASGEEEKALQLGDRITIPGGIISTFRDGRGEFQKRLLRVEQGELFAEPDDVEVLRRASVLIETGQFMRLPTMRIRAIAGLLHLFSTGGDDRKILVRKHLRIPFSFLCQAAGIDVRQGKLRRDLFDAFDWLSRTQVYIPIENVREDGTREIYGERTAICSFRPIWTQLGEADSRAVQQQWAARTSFDDGPGPWEGDLPDEVELTLPDAARFVFRSLNVNADILQRLEQGARGVRGGMKGFLDIDWALFLEISQNVQFGQFSDDGRGSRSYVDRDSFFLAFFGEEELAKHRRTGNYRSRVVMKYEKAAQVLLEAGVVTNWTPEHKAKRGDRDVFDCNPEVFLGMERRVEKRKAVEAAKKRPRGRKRPAKKPE